MEVTFATARKKQKCRTTACDTAVSAESGHHAQERAPVVGLPRFLQLSPESQPLFVQTKLVVGAHDDAFEREADRTAGLAKATETGDISGPTNGAAHVAQSDVANAAEKFVQPKANGYAAAPSPSVNTVVGATGAGTPVPSNVREKVEPVLGADLSDVRVHTDAAAHSSARRLEAKAFTHQNHIWLGPHHSADDVELMAHELTHVVQQTGRDESPQMLQRLAEDTPGASGDEVRQRLQQRIDEALGDDAPERLTPEAGSAENVEASTAPPHVDPEAREAARVTDRAALHEKTEELEPDVQPPVEEVREQQPEVEEAARTTVETLEQPPGQRSADGAAAEGAAAAGAVQPEAAAAAEGTKEGGAAGEQAASAVEQAASAAEEAFAVAESQMAPDMPEVMIPPPEIAPVDAGGVPLAGDPAADVRAIELANEAQNLREEGQLFREHSAEEMTNAFLLRGNVRLVGQGIAGSQGDVSTVQNHLTFRRELLAQSRQALAVSEQKAADVATRAPEGVAQTNENKERSAPLASEARDLTAENEANTPEDEEAAENAREQGGQLNRAGSDAASIDDTLTQVQGAANTLVQDAARATQLNAQATVKTAAIEMTLGRTEGRIVQMQGQNVEAVGRLDALRDQPGEAAAQAGELDVQGQDLIQGSRDIESRLHSAQQGYSQGMAAVPVELSPAAAEGTAVAEPTQEVAPIEESVPVMDAAPTGAVVAEPPVEPPPPTEAASSEDVLIQRQAEDGAAPVPSNIDISEGLPSWLTGRPSRTEAEREVERVRQQREQEERRQREFDLIGEELHGRHFEELSAGERRVLALRLMTNDTFRGLSDISWPTPGGIASGAAHLAGALIDPRGPMMGAVSGLNMIINSSVNFARDPSWSGALRLAANVATGLAIILGSITALAAVIAALMTAIIIFSLGFAAPIAGPVLAFCASVMSIVGGWTVWVGLIAAGLQALTFLVDLYMAGTAQTAEQLIEHADHMREDASNAGNSLLQAGMGRLSQMGGRQMQARIAATPGGAVGFARGMPGRFASGVRAAPGRIMGGIRGVGRGFMGGARMLGRGLRGIGRGAAGGYRRVRRGITGIRDAIRGRLRRGAPESPVGMREPIRLGGEAHHLAIRAFGRRLVMTLCSDNCGALIDKARRMLNNLPEGHPARGPLDRFIRQATRAEARINSVPNSVAAQSELEKMRGLLEDIERAHPDAIDPNVVMNPPAVEGTPVTQQPTPVVQTPIAPGGDVFSRNRLSTRGLDPDRTLGDQLAGNSQLANLQSSPNLRGVGAQELPNLTPRQLAQMVEDGRITTKVFNSIMKTGEGRNLGGGN